MTASDLSLDAEAAITVTFPLDAAYQMQESPHRGAGPVETASVKSRF